MSKMFVHYSGTVDAFSKLSNIADYNNKIVFIKGGTNGEGSAIYTHGKYYANIADIEALAKQISELTYFSSVKAGGVTATATGHDGIIEFTSDDDTTVTVVASSTGVKIGLNSAFVKQVDDATSDIATIKSDYLKSSDKSAIIGVSTDASTASTIYGVKKYAEEKASAAETAAATDATTKANKAESNAKLYADGLKTTIESGYAEADETTLDLAKEYVDDEIAKLNSSAIAAQVEANKTAIATLNGTGTGSVSKQVADAIADVINNAPEDFDTLKEVADWIANDTTGAAKMQADIATLKGSDTTTGSVAKTVKDAIADLDVTDTAVVNKYVSAVSETDGKITVTRADLPTYTLTTGTANGTVKFNGTAVSVYGLKSAAYTEASAYATAAQGAKADAAAPQATTYTKTEVDDMWAWEEL